jgi:hypothetical protein
MEYIGRGGRLHKLEVDILMVPIEMLILYIQQRSIPIHSLGKEWIDAISGAHLQESFNSAAGVFRTGSIKPMGQEAHQR